MTTLLALFGPLGPWEIILILLALLLLFGRRLPEVGRALGQGLLEFKKGVQDVKTTADPDAPVASAATPSAATPSAIAPSATAPTAPPCPSCGTVADADAKFCPKCGAARSEGA